MVLLAVAGPCVRSSWNATRGQVAPVAVDDLAAQVHGAIGRWRADRGNPPLVRRDDLDRAARLRAGQVLELATDAIDAREPLAPFLEREGVLYVERAAERVLQVDNSPDPGSRLMEMLLRAETESPLALENRFREVGIGVARGGTGRAVLVVLAARRSPPPAPAELTRLERAIEREINAIRTEHGLRALVARPELAEIARSHSSDMARRGYFDHISPDGISAADRVRAAGLRYRFVAENVAMNQGMKDPAQVTVRGWMDSEGHRANILDPDLTQTGVGVAVSEKGALYFTQLFLTPRRR